MHSTSGQQLTRLTRNSANPMRLQSNDGAVRFGRQKLAKQKEVGEKNQDISSTSLSSLSSHKSSNMIVGFRATAKSDSLLLLLLISSALVSVLCAGNRSQIEPTGATNAYGEPIKWSFGGWAPLDGKAPNGTATSPLPPHARVARQQQAASEPLKESASISHGEQVQYQAANGAKWAGSPDSQQHQSMKLLTGPAYAMPMQRAQQFSPPAPAPIIRGHLLGPHQSPNRQRPMQQQRYQPPQQPHRMHAQLMQHNQMRPNAHPYPMAQQHRPMHLAEMHLQQQREQQKYHQQHMRQQQMQHEQMHQQQMMQHQQFRPPAVGNAYRQPARYPAAASAPQVSHHHQEREPAHVGSYKVINGEQPVIFTHSLAAGPQPDRMPVLEVNGRANNTYANGQVANEQHAKTTAGYSSSPSSERDNANYQIANSYQMADDHHQQPQGNNIQDIKQQQLQYSERQRSEADKPAAKSPYLTIPVAVETEGDKVLTADDINEIEKHVINVLPNMKTADKIVKMADAHLALAPVTLSSPQPQQPASSQPPAEQQQRGVAEPELHQVHYDEHRSTMKQLEGDLKEPVTRPAGEYRTSTQQAEQHSTVPATSYGPQSSPSMTSTTGGQEKEQPAQQQQQQQQEVHVVEPQYFVATGPAQELGTFDPDQIGDYNLIKNDLLNNFRYEPTRAQPGARGQQTASTQPMPYSPSPVRHNPPTATVTRYFQQGPAQNQPNRQHRGRGLFGRLNGGFGRQQQQQQEYPSTASPSAGSTKTLGGRKVSEVMRPLIHTTPVPMTSPIHVPSVEPEKVDAIQLIASSGNGQANDKRPMVVEAHQLVNHTPDGGIDYNSGAPMGNYSQGQQQESRHNSQHQSDQQGAIIEYVAINEQALNNAANQQQSHDAANQQQQQHYEIAGQQEVQPIYVSGEQAPATRQPYDYTMPTESQSSSHAGQQQQQQQEQVQPTPPSTYLVSDHSPANHQPEEGSLAAWSPSVASEHQRQQIELNEHAPMQQMDMPATAGYNFFNQQQDQPATATSGQPQEYENKQETTGKQDTRWRTKAGGSQPNPDAQYDGQIAAGGENSGEQQQREQLEQQSLADDDNKRGQYSNYDNQQQQQTAAVELTRMTQVSDLRPQGEEEQRQQVNDNGNNEAADDYQQQRLHQTTATTQADGNEATQQQQQHSTSGDSGYVTNSFVGGAQMNHQGGSSYDKQPQYGYMKLDRDRQQSHLAKHQAQHQARLAEMMNQQQSYQTTTPMSITTAPTTTIDQQQQAEVAQQQQQQQAADEQQQQDAGQPQQQDGYMVEQVPARPSVQSSPDTMLVNDAPMQYPILDQQSLISDESADQNNANNEYSSDDQRAVAKQPAGVYQVYQAYYAPKDHKPLPGYVRLSLEEFHDLFRDAEIQYVDKNLNGLAAVAANQEQHRPMESVDGGYDRAEMMGTASSEQQSILVDRRSISERRSSNSTLERPDDHELAHKGKSTGRKTKIGQVVKKIISIRNSSRQMAKQQQQQANKPGSSSNNNKKLTLMMTSSSEPVAASFASGKESDAGKPTKQSLASMKRKAEVPVKKVNAHHQLKNQSKVFDESPTTIERPTTKVTHKQSQELKKLTT